MLEITLMKSLYHEMNPEKIPNVTETTNEDASRFRTLAIHLPAYPKLKTFTAEVRYMAYGSAMYYLHFNDNLEIEEDIQSPMAKDVILHFYTTYQPSYLKEDLPEDFSSICVLDCFDVAKIPDYRPKYAFPGLVLYEDMKNGNYKAVDGSMPTFPGIRMLNQDRNSTDPENEKPAYIAKDENYTKFDGNNDEFQNKLEELKKQFELPII
ncbi:MAG: hypothetical protein Q4B70_17025 [Lachnospiraceae bacterium]|nr:hypothetical protein [Lachnospiraceae bacterium]